MKSHLLGRSRRLAAAALSALAVVALVPFAAPSASAALAVTGPVDQATGFPTYYEDSNGLRLGLCLQGAPPCFTTRPDLTRPASFPDNFPADGEAFWMIAEAALGRSVGKRDLYRAAVEGAFLPDVAAGNQVAFTRIRFRYDALVPGASYTFTHPYGVNTFTADAVGVINDTVDTGCLTPPCAGFFDAAMAGPVGPFLQWDPTVGGAPPAGFVGVFGTPHVVTGSPNGTNFLRAVGPNIGGVGINSMQTNLFDLAGQLAPAAPGVGASVTPTSLAFPSSKVGTPTAVQNTAVTNVGTSALSISGLGLAGTNPTDFNVITDGCTGQTLTTNATCAIGVRFNPTAGGARSAVLNVIDNAPTSPQTVALSGTGLAAILTATPTTADFGSVKIDTLSATKTITLANTGTDNAVIDTIDVTGAAASDFLVHEDNCAGLTLAPSGSCTVVMAFAPTATGTRAASLSVVNNTPTSPFSIGLRGIGTAPRPSFSPSSMSFGSQLILLSTTEQQVTLTNRGNASLAISGFSIGGANAGDFSISGNTCGATLLAGRACVIKVKFVPGFLGSRTGTLNLISDAPATSPSTVTLSGTGNLIVI